LTGGTYNAPIYVELKATQNEAKIFYSYNPDGGPSDSFLYTGALLLKKTTPLVFFAMVDYSNDSKIKINYYNFDYSHEILFASGTMLRLSDSLGMIQILNNSTGAVDLGLWSVKTQDETITIPEETVVEAGSGYTIPTIKYSGQGMLTLFSPDEEEKAIFEVPNIAETVTATDVPKAEPVKNVPILPPSRPRPQEPAAPVVVSTQNTPTNPTIVPAVAPAETVVTPATVPVTDTPTTPTEALPAPAEIVNTPAPTETVVPTTPANPASSDLADNLKTSAANAGAGSEIPLFILMGAFLIIIVRSAFWYIGAQKIKVAKK